MTAATIDPKPTPNVDESLAEMRKQLETRGFAHVTHDLLTLPRTLLDLGHVIDVTEVTPDDEEGGHLVTSKEELELHTDHFGAEYIVWECVEQAFEGGVSLLADARLAYEALSPEHQAALEDVPLTEHRMFEGDPSARPLVTQGPDGPRFYYSLWLLNPHHRDHPAIVAFREALRQVPTHRIRLQPGELLIVDNRRVLHGRAAFQGNRHIRRFWLASEKLERLDAATLTFPEKISDSRVDELIDAGVEPAIAKIDLSMVKMKLRDSEEGDSWSVEKCEMAELEYKRFLTLNFRYPDQDIVPTKLVDEIWHQHILDTRAYTADSQVVFGEYFHHYPYFGMRGDGDAANLSESFLETVRLYQKDFGDDMLRNDSSSKCWHDCQGRCWHECKSD